MQIDDTLINYLENLSYLTLDDKERARLSSDLQNILKNMESLSELDTSGVNELSHPFDNVNNFRKDEVKQGFDRSLILRNAKVKNDEMFIVPKTVE